MGGEGSFFVLLYNIRAAAFSPQAAAFSPQAAAFSPHAYIFSREAVTFSREAGKLPLLSSDCVLCVDHFLVSHVLYFMFNLLRFWWKCFILFSICNNAEIVFNKKNLLLKNILILQSLIIKNPNNYKY